MSTLRACATLTALLAVSAAAVAQDDETLDRTPIDCVIVSNIDKTEVIDDYTILFFMRGNQIYRNQLSRRCPTLAREDRFAYRTTSNRLCDIDTVTVLEQRGLRLEDGFTCRLGQFHPITEEEVAELKRIQEQGSSRDAVEVEAVELPEGSAETAVDSDDASSEPAEPERRRRSRRR
jgi:hypothetical protein